MTVKYKVNLHKNDFDTWQEYNRERMKIVNRMKTYEVQRERWKTVMQLIAEYEGKGMSHDDIADELAKALKYRLFEFKVD